MKRTIRDFALVSSMAFVLATSANTVLCQSRDERAVRAASDAWQRYIAAQQVDSIVALHTPDAVVMFANSPVVKGSNGIRAGWGEIVKLPNLSMHWVPQTINVVSPTVATEYGTYTDSYDTPNGKEGDSGSYITIWHKVNGKWRVALDAPVSSMPAPAGAPPEGANFIAQSGSALDWHDFNSPGFAPGAKVSVLSGDPSKPGQFALRLSFPDGYMVPLHWHPTAETVTVISGAGMFGMGNTVDMGSAHAFTAGDYVFIPARHPHFLQTRGATVVQVSGNGPFQINLGAPR
jgi:ketosteroid isomerase-like protein/quercetin dioxygenase-like cupin family protein